MQNTRSKAVFYCGTNGAGKSTLRRLNQDDVSVVIDSDRIAAELNPANPRAADMEAGKKGRCVCSVRLSKAAPLFTGIHFGRRFVAKKDADRQSGRVPYHFELYRPVFSRTERLPRRRTRP